MDESELIEAARAARIHAYAPFSRYRVGAAVRTDDGRVFTGCNVENSSYGLTVCAERVATFAAVAAGARIIQAVAIATDDAGAPCGACRQVLAEFAPRDGTPLTVLMSGENGSVKTAPLADLLPQAFRIEVSS